MIAFEYRWGRVEVRNEWKPVVDGEARRMYDVVDRNMPNYIGEFVAAANRTARVLEGIRLWASWDQHPL